MMRAALTWAVCTTYLWVAPAAHATSMELYGFGPRATALAGTAEAVADDFYALYANPANLAYAKHIHFGYGTDAVWNRMSVDRNDPTGDYPTRLPSHNWLGHVGVSTPLGGWAKDKAAFGLAFHMPLSGVTRLDALDHRTPQLVMYDTLGDRLTLLAGAAVRPWPWLSFGAAVQLLTTLEGQARVDLAVLDHRVTRKELQVELLTRPYPILGVTVQPREDIRLAAVWRAESEVRYRQPLAVRVEDVGELAFVLEGVGLWLPDTLAVAGSWQRGPWLVTAGAVWARWSQLPPLAPAVVLRLDDRELVSQQGKADLLVDMQNTPVPIGARDILQPRAGVEWQRGGMVWRAGVQYRPTPLPKADGAATYLDAPATTVALGAGVQLADPLELARRPLQIDAALGWTVLSRRTVQKLDPADPAGDTSVYGDNLHLSVALHHDF
ncbi:MAG: OmpP1/FadL family transporter [Myxococcota bacterium]